MDELTSVLDGPRAQNAFVVKAIMAPPWAIRIQDEAPVTITAILRGNCWIRYDDGYLAHAQAGDVAIMRSPDPYEVADSQDTEAAIVIHPGQRCTTLDGVELHDVMTLGTRTWGNTTDDRATIMLTGTYHLDGDLDRHLLASLPRHIRVGRADAATSIVALLSDEIAKNLPGQQAVLDRLLDLLLVSSLRTWFDGQGDKAPAWYRAHQDPLIGPSLRLMQHQPAEPWSVAKLASAAGCSRAVFARRFRELVGQPPMEFLTEWRLSLAADQLREPSRGLSAVASSVGYATPYALSIAFKRVRGVSPAEYRKRWPLNVQSR
jgi:AraC-like DNA-binding protein